MFGRKRRDFCIPLEDVGVVDEDLGTSWHPHYLADGELLEDVSEEMMKIHFAKEERCDQVDAVIPIESAPIDGSGGVK